MSSVASERLPSPDIGLMQVDDELAFLHLEAAEAEQLYTEVFVEEVYAQPPIQPLADGAYVVDVGACYGLFSMWCLHRCRPAGILAVEPVPILCDIVARNLAMCPLKGGCDGEGCQVEIAQVALSATAAPDGSSRTTVIFFPEAPGESTQFAAERRRIQDATVDACKEMNAGSATTAEVAGLGLGVAKLAALQARAEELQSAGAGAQRAHTVVKATLSQLLLPLAWPRIDLLKIDCEGAELEVLRGIEARHWPLVRQVVMEVHDENHRLAAVVQLLEEKGFQVSSQLQGTRLVDGDFLLFTPHALRMHYVYAVRASV